MSKAFDKVKDPRLRARVTRLGAGAVALVLLLAVAGPLLADFQQEAKLLPDDGAAGGYFGYSVAVDGDTAVIGAWLDYGIGSAYVFVREGTAWTQQAKLLADDGFERDMFAESVAVDGDTVVVGAAGDDDNGRGSGSAYVFVRSGTEWTQQAKLLADDGAESEFFGYPVTVDGDTVVVGAWRDEDNGHHAGSAYVFVREGTAWTQQAKLLADDGAEGDRFGISVAITGDTVVVGADADNDNGNYSGSAYVFVREGTIWTQQAKLLADDGTELDHLGSSVAVSADTVVVGAVGDDEHGFGTGSAYVFVREGTAWTQQAKLLADDGAEYDWFAESIAIDGDTVVVGAWGDDDNGADSGSAYIFVREGTAWMQQAKLLADDGAEGDQFGVSVTMDGDTLVAGAWGDDIDGDGSGSAYVYKTGGHSVYLPLVTRSE